MTEPRRSSRRPSTRRRAVALDEGDPVVARTNGGRAPRAIDPYDAVPYNACPVAIAHPDRLAAAALRNGWVCTPPARCRMLELGCADATNLIPLAITYPSSQFVGVERSASQIGVARAELEALGIRNVELLHMDIEDLDEDLGEFDYIVAHSVFSWVSEHARARILRIMHANLSARGVAFLSYNTLPGWSLHGAIRDLLRAHTQEIDDPSAKVASARAHIVRLAALGPGWEGQPQSLVLAQVFEGLATRSDSFLLHEYLSEHNRAFGFVELLDTLDAHGLWVLADLVRSTTTYTSHDSLHAALEREGLPPREVETALDLLTGRKLRASLICRSVGAPVAAHDQAERLADCELAVAAPPRVAPQQRKSSRTGVASSAREVEWLRTALSALTEVWPGGRHVGELMQDTGVDETDRAQAMADLLRMCDLGYLELRAHPLRLVTTASSRPMVSPKTRRDAARGRRVTNQLHVQVALADQTLAVAALLDGHRTVAELVEEIGARGGLPSVAHGDAEALHRTVVAELDVLAAHALLLG